jgi:hypothetical protein
MLLLLHFCSGFANLSPPPINCLESKAVYSNYMNGFAVVWCPVHLQLHGSNKQLMKDSQG